MDVSEHYEEMIEYCAALAAGNIESRDRQVLAEHIADGCLECEVALADFEQAALLLAASAPSALPSPALRDRVLQSAASGAAPVSPAAPGTTLGPSAAFSAQVAEMRRRRKSFAPPPWTALAVAGVFAVVAIVAVIAAMMASAEAKRLREESAGNTKIVAALNDQLEQEKMWGAVLAAPDARIAELRPTAQADPTLTARAVYDPRTQHAVLVFRNLQPPPGREFEAWAVSERSWQSLGVIKTDEQGRGVLRVESAGDPNRLSSFQVSLEHTGGSGNATAPTGPVVMIGRLQG